MRDGFGFVESQVVVEEEEELLLHEIDLRGVEQLGKARPVLVLRRGVVEILGRNDEGREEHAMARAGHP